MCGFFPYFAQINYIFSNLLYSQGLAAWPEEREQSVLYGSAEARLGISRT